MLISAISALRRGQRASSSVMIGAPTITPMAYALINMPACGIDTCTPSAITGSKPIGENSVVPMPKAPAASASSGSVALLRSVEGVVGFMLVRSEDQHAHGDNPGGDRLASWE